MKLPKKHKFSGIEYEVEATDILGVTDSHKYIESKKSILINKKLRGRALLDVLIHEAIHAMAPYLAEEAVEEMGTDISNFLWKCGYRKGR